MKEISPVNILSYGISEQMCKFKYIDIELYIKAVDSGVEVIWSVVE